MASDATLEGVLVVDKPQGPTSHDVVACVRRATGIRKVGHLGTLDPMATGVLPVAIGRATRLAPWLTGAPKQYRAVITLGRVTDSYDITGTEVGGALPLNPSALAFFSSRFMLPFSRETPTACIAFSTVPSSRFFMHCSCSFAFSLFL